MAVQQHTVRTLAQLNALADLANGKGLGQGPYRFYGPIFEVANEEEMLRCFHADFEATLPGGYVARRDTLKVYQLVNRPYSVLGNWVQTGIAVFNSTAERNTALPAPAAGTLSVILSGNTGFPQVEVYRGAVAAAPGRPGIPAQWESVRAHSTLSTIRRNALVRSQLTGPSGLAPAASNDRFVFTNGGSNRIVSREPPTFVRPSGSTQFVNKDGQLKLAGLSYIAPAGATVQTVLSGGYYFNNSTIERSLMFGTITERTSTHYRAVFRMRMLGQWPGRLQMTIVLVVFNPASDFEFDVQDSGLPYVHEVSSTQPYGLFHIDAPWPGEEFKFDCIVRSATPAAWPSLPAFTALFQNPNSFGFEYVVDGPPSGV